jgi:hypothetical protein
MTGSREAAPASGRRSPVPALGALLGIRALTCHFWSPLTESNRRPSPYHGAVTAPIGQWHSGRLAAQGGCKNAHVAAVLGGSSAWGPVSAWPLITLIPGGSCRRGLPARVSADQPDPGCLSAGGLLGAAQAGRSAIRFDACRPSGSGRMRPNRGSWLFQGVLSGVRASDGSAPGPGFLVCRVA